MKNDIEKSISKTISLPKYMWDRVEQVAYQLNFKKSDIVYNALANHFEMPDETDETNFEAWKTQT